MNFLSSIFFQIFILVDFNLACYVINCPLGTKRATNLRYCRTCANGLGMCFGPRICCGPDIGCLFDTKVSQSCEFEDFKYKSPCVPYGKSCSLIAFGKCATKNVCCNSNGCIFDESCNEQDIVKLLDLNLFNSSSRSGKKMKDKLTLAMKHLLHNTKQRRLDFSEII